MMYNLLKNAVEHSGTGQKITISLEQDVNANLIVIHNENAVPEEIRNNFFEKHTTSSKKNGTGLGTYSAKLAAETQGGAIDMETSEEKGTTIAIHFSKFGDENLS